MRSAQAFKNDPFSHKNTRREVGGTKSNVRCKGIWQQDMYVRNIKGDLRIRSVVAAPRRVISIAVKLWFGRALVEFGLLRRCQQWSRPSLQACQQACAACGWSYTQPGCWHQVWQSIYRHRAVALPRPGQAVTAGNRVFWYGNFVQLSCKVWAGVGLAGLGSLLLN